MRARMIFNSIQRSKFCQRWLPQNPWIKVLNYANLASLSPTSIGTRYEYLCASSLSRLSFSVMRTGGRSDAGIDLLGTWRLPTLPYPLRVLVQCKALKAKILPETVRELEGVAAGAPEGWRNDKTIGVLCAKRPATKGVREAVMRSGTPILWIMIEDTGKSEGRVKQVLWNQKVSELGAEGMAVGLRHVCEMGEPMDSEAVLLWKGKPWESNRSIEDRKITRYDSV